MRIKKIYRIFKKKNFKILKMRRIINKSRRDYELKNILSLSSFLWDFSTKKIKCNIFNLERGIYRF